MQDNPRLKGNPVTRMVQKHKIQRQYAKALRDTKKAARRSQKTGSAVGNITKSLAGAVRRHPVACVIALLCGLLLVFFSSMFSSATSMMMSGAGTVLSTSYLAADTDIDAAELAYTEWETDLRLEAMNAETSHPGFDECAATRCCK